MKIDEKLSEVLNVENNKSDIIVSSEKDVVPLEDNIDEIHTDYTHARKTFKNLIDAGEKAISNLEDLAKEMESPRAYEVLASMIKTVSETTKDLFELQKKNKEVTSINNKNEKSQVLVDKAVFVGTTAELLKQIKENKNDII